jgi:putative FmdB family regulatory protein
MPTYDYECKKCGEKTEIFHGINDAPKRKCPACGKNSLKRLISAGAGVIFKGTGFYETDYKRPAMDKLKDVGKQINDMNKPSGKT